MLKISDLLRKIRHIERIEDPRQRIKEFAEFIAVLKDFAYQCEDSKLIEAVRNLSISEEKARIFYRIEALRSNLKNLKNSLKENEDIIPTDTAGYLLNCIDRFEDTLITLKEQASVFVYAFSRATRDLIHELVGRRLEREIVPDLAKKLGYSSRPNVFLHNNCEIEVDFVGERDITTSPFGTGKLKRKEVLIVECKTTISKSDIDGFAKKISIIKAKYEISAKAFQYDLNFDAWLVSCYGWTDELKDMAKKNNIKPFGKEELENILQKYGLLDHRIPVCP